MGGKLSDNKQKKSSIRFQQAITRLKNLFNSKTSPVEFYLQRVWYILSGLKPSFQLTKENEGDHVVLSVSGGKHTHTSSEVSSHHVFFLMQRKHETMKNILTIHICLCGTVQTTHFNSWRFDEFKSTFWFNTNLRSKNHCIVSMWLTTNAFYRLDSFTAV